MASYLYDNDTAGRYPGSWYAATANAAPERPQLEGDGRADVAIVGGGYAGLSAAYHLAKAGLDVALVDAHRMGWGASGRNGGQLGSSPRRDMAFYERAVGLADAKKIFDLSLEANALARSLIAEHGIACDLKDGILYTNHRARLDGPLKAEIDQYTTVYGHPDLRYLSTDETREIVRSGDAFASLMDGVGAHLHPLNYALGLAHAADAAGARLYERTEATRIDVAGARIETAEGALSADWLILAMNGYHNDLEPTAAPKVVPLHNFILATEPLPEGGREALTRDVAVADTRFTVNYYRLSPDGRMLFGAGETGALRFPRDLEALVRPRMATVFPQLAAAPAAYIWGGTLGISVNRTPVFLRLSPRTLSISGWSGSGVHMATLGGKIAAEAVRGAAARFDLLAGVPAPAFPGGRMLRPPLLSLAFLWYRMLDRL